MAEKKRGLGRGLGALIPESAKPPVEQKSTESVESEQLDLDLGVEAPAPCPEERFT